MKIYEERSYWEEFDRTSILELNDDGRFSYSDSFSSYGGGFGGKVQGNWHQSGNTVFFRPEHVEGSTFHKWVVGQEQQAIEQDDCINFGGFSLHRDEPRVQAARQPESEKTVKPDDADKQKKQLPRVAKLHFKDGSIQERELTNVPLFSLFDKLFYQLVDENGNTTNYFKARQNLKNNDSSIVEYDEIDFTSNRPD